MTCANDIILSVKHVLLLLFTEQIHYSLKAYNGQLRNYTIFVGHYNYLTTDKPLSLK